MNIFSRNWRRFKHGMKFAKLGKGCSLTGASMDIAGHVELGDHCKIRDNVVIRANTGGKIIIGTYSGISYGCIIEARTIIKIGRFTGLAEYTVVRDTNHSVMGTADHWRLTPHISKPIVIGDACMITSGCYITPGVAIGDGAVLAQHSVVTKDVGPFEVWAGNPARKVAHRVKDVPEAVHKRYQELLGQYGLRTDRRGYKEILESIKETAFSGVNHAAEERDRLMRELKAEGHVLAEGDSDDEEVQPEPHETER